MRCEGHGFSQDQCLAVGCCLWDYGKVGLATLIVVSSELSCSVGRQWVVASVNLETTLAGEDRTIMGAGWAGTTMVVGPGLWGTMAEVRAHGGTMEIMEVDQDGETMGVGLGHGRTMETMEVDQDGETMTVDLGHGETMETMEVDQDGETMVVGPGHGGTMETMEVDQDGETMTVDRGHGTMETTGMDPNGETMETMGVVLWVTMETTVVKIIVHGGTMKVDQESGEIMETMAVKNTETMTPVQVVGTGTAPVRPSPLMSHLPLSVS